MDQNVPLSTLYDLEVSGPQQERRETFTRGDDNNTRVTFDQSFQIRKYQPSPALDVLVTVRSLSYSIIT